MQRRGNAAARAGFRPRTTVMTARVSAWRGDVPDRRANCRERCGRPNLVSSLVVCRLSSRETPRKSEGRTYAKSFTEARRKSYTRHRHAERVRKGWECRGEGVGFGELYTFWSCFVSFASCPVCVRPRLRVGRGSLDSGSILRWKEDKWLAQCGRRTAGQLRGKLGRVGCHQGNGRGNGFRRPNENHDYNMPSLELTSLFSFPVPVLAWCLPKGTGEPLT